MRLVCSCLVVLLFVLGCAGAGNGLVRVVNAGGDDSCSKLTNYCLVARCSLENKGSQPRSVDLTYIMTQSSGMADKYTETVTLGGHALETFTHQFDSAKVTGGAGRVECRLGL